MPENLNAYKGRVVLYATNAVEASQKAEKLNELAKREGLDIFIDDIEALV